MYLCIIYTYIDTYMKHIDVSIDTSISIYLLQYVNI